jgi:hypothetical protein
MTERDGPMTPKAFHAVFGRIGRHRRASITRRSTDGWKKTI